jgi:hypothetical protein
MSQPIHACGTAGCPREGQPTRARLCDACGMPKHSVNGTARDARARTRNEGMIALMPSSRGRGRRGAVRGPAAACALVGALALVGLRVLIRKQSR